MLTLLCATGMLVLAVISLIEGNLIYFFGFLSGMVGWFGCYILEKRIEHLQVHDGSKRRVIEI